MKVIREELGFLANPMLFKTPKGFEKLDSGAQLFLQSLHSVNVKRNELERKLSKDVVLPQPQPQRDDEQSAPAI